MNKALVVVDMQEDFIDGSLGSEEAKAIVANVTNEIKRFDGIVLYTMDTHFSDYLTTQEGKKLPIEHCIFNTNGWLIDRSVMAALEDRKATGFCKNTFGCIDLIEYVEEHHDGHPFDVVEFIGLDTDICVISNALLYKAYYPESTVVVKSSCCAGSTPENHQSALDVMRMCQIEIVGD